LENKKTGTRYPYTDLDLAVTNRDFLLMKACLPLIPPTERHILAIYIKFQEFYATLNLRNLNNNHKAFRKNIPADLSELINIIGDYLDEEQLNSINGFQEMMEMIQLMNELNDFDE